MASLKSQLAQPDIVVAPGVYDALSALLAARAGFNALYLSGASIAYTRLGRPDLGLVSMDEVADTLRHIRERVEVPFIVDGDTGFGNALNVMRTVRLFERYGAAAVQLEDQVFPKRCGHLQGKALVSTNEMAGKIKAATDARATEDFLIIARTDAIAVEGFDAALDRGEAYIAAGADLLFVEAPQDETEMRRLCERFKDRIPLMANMVEGGKTPLFAADKLQALGYSLVIFPGGTLRALIPRLTAYYASLRRHGTTEPQWPEMLDFAELNDLLGTAEMLAEGRKYDGE
jgi:methylisocitrate lyase